MRTYSQIIVLGFLAVLPLKGFAQDGDYPWSSGCTAQNILSAKVVLIEAQSRSSAFSRGGKQLFADTVTVLGSSDNSVSGTISILGLTTSGSSGPELYRLDPSHRYICVIATSPGSQDLEAANPGSANGIAIAKSDNSEVLGLFACPTNLTSLNSGSDGVQVLQRSVISSLSGMTSYDVARATNFLYSCGPDRLFPDPQTLTNKLHKPFADDSLTVFMKDQASSAYPYVRAKILQLLVRWKIENSELPYLQSLVAASSDPAAFSVGNDPVDVDYSYGYSSYWEQSYAEPKLALDDWTSAIANASSRRILRFLLQNVEPSTAPGVSQLAVIAGRLNDLDEEMRYLTVTLLCRFTGDTIHTASVVRSETGTTYPNLPSAVDYWKSHYGVDSSP